MIAFLAGKATPLKVLGTKVVWLQKKRSRKHGWAILRWRDYHNMAVCDCLIYNLNARTHQSWQHESSLLFFLARLSYQINFSNDVEWWTASISSFKNVYITCEIKLGKLLWAIGVSTFAGETFINGQGWASFPFKSDRNLTNHPLQVQPIKTVQLNYIFCWCIN